MAALCIVAKQTSAESLAASQGSCYPQLVGQRFEGLFQLSKTADGGYSMDITIAFPYQIFGPGSWTDYAYTSGSTSFAPKIGPTRPRSPARPVRARRAAPARR